MTNDQMAQQDRDVALIERAKGLATLLGCGYRVLGVGSGVLFVSDEYPRFPISMPEDVVDNLLKRTTTASTGQTTSGEGFMCVGCNVQDATPNWSFRWHWGKWYNFIPPKYRLWRRSRGRWRGEGNPAPWLMVWNGNYGLQVGLTRYRLWLHPELSKVSVGTRQLMWGFFIIAWRITS